MGIWEGSEEIRDIAALTVGRNIAVEKSRRGEARLKANDQMSQFWLALGDVTHRLI